MVPYTVADWRAERERIQPQEIAAACRSCGRTGFYGPREADNGRKYRLCKFCGFYQCVGEDPVQFRPCAHQCESWPEVLGAPYIQWIGPDQKSYDCFYCAEDVPSGPTAIPRPAETEDHPWREVPQGLTYGGYQRFWLRWIGKPRRFL